LFCKMIKLTEGKSTGASIRLQVPKGAGEGERPNARSGKGTNFTTLTREKRITGEDGKKGFVNSKKTGHRGRPGQAKKDPSALSRTEWKSYRGQMVHTRRLVQTGVNPMGKPQPLPEPKRPRHLTNGQQHGGEKLILGNNEKG